MKRPSTTAPHSSLASPGISVLCFGLIGAAWILDLLTPQLFVAAILYNGPIALSGLALNTRLTTALVVVAQIANVVTGYLNGMQSHGHWDPVAIGDRVLSAASFLLVGYLTTRAQDYAREAGSATERAQVAAGEKALRHADEAVRATLNVDLVMRAIVREAAALSNAGKAMIVVRASQLDLPDLYTIERSSRDAVLERRALDAPTTTLVQRATEEARMITAGDDDAVARMLLDAHHSNAMISVRLTGGDKTVVLFVFAEVFARGSERLLQAFAASAGVALDQAWLFMQLGYRNEQIAAQRDALEERNRVIRDIVYALAHDLRTPLSAMNVTMQQALDGAYGEMPEAYRSVLRTTLLSNAGLRRLVDTLLLVARLESGESSTLRERVEVDVELSRVADELRPLADAKSVTLLCSSVPANVMADASEIRRAVSNLVANAIDATPAGGAVEIRATPRDGLVEIAIEDDGYGIAPEQRAQLFQRFAPNGRAVGSGTGLGLYIVRLIAEKLGGSVSYAPREPHGSIFTVTLPAAAE